MNKFIKVQAGIYELYEDGKATRRAYKNKYGGWTLAVWHEYTQSWLDSRHFSTLKQITQRAV